MRAARARATAAALALAAGSLVVPGAWLTPEQHAQRLLEGGDARAAAAAFEDPLRAGAAWYRAGEFERAAAAFLRSDTAEAHYNRGNALVMRGAYDAAGEAYREALARRPGWTEAEDNRRLAALRAERLAPPADDAGGTGGALEADELRFDDTQRTARGGVDAELADGAFTDAALRERWLRRVQTRPGDLLRIRFAMQLAARTEAAP